MRYVGQYPDQHCGDCAGYDSRAAVGGVLQLSPRLPVLLLAGWYVQLFRNAPALILIYFATYVFPFELHIGSHYINFPDWSKVTLGLALPASANVAELFRGAIASIPAVQWEAAASLALRRRQILSWIILSPWMNLYSTITMSAALASLVGGHDLLDSAQIASTTVNRIDFTIAVYFIILLLFFIYCYPISRLTQYLEKNMPSLDSATPPLVHLQDVHLACGHNQVLKGIDLQVRRGQAVSIIGPSGSGKSTILRCITGLLKPQSGRILLGDTDVRTLKSEAELSDLR